MSRPPLLLIEWEDAFNGNHEWTWRDEVPKAVAPLIVHTVGFLVQRDNERVTLAMSWEHSRDHPKICDLFTIPAGMVRRETTLRK